MSKTSVAPRSRTPKPGKVVPISPDSKSPADRARWDFEFQSEMTSNHLRGLRARLPGPAGRPLLSREHRPARAGALTRAGLWTRGLGSAHRFRRSFASAYMKVNPGALEGLRRLMRHEQISTTCRYVFLEPEDLAARLAKVQL